MVQEIQDGSSDQTEMSESPMNGFLKDSFGRALAEEFEPIHEFWKKNEDHIKTKTSWRKASSIVIVIVTGSRESWEERCHRCHYPPLYPHQHYFLLQ